MTAIVGRMPAEFSPHEQTVMCWPAREDLYGDRFAEAEEAHALVASSIARYEHVTVLADRRFIERASRIEGPNISVVEIPLDDAWFRDSGPIYVLDDANQRVAVDFTFNGWGKKYMPFDTDADAARAWAQHNGDALRSVDMVFEGGSISSDGAGTIITTMQCLLNPNRNPHLSQREIEEVLRRELGAEVVVWLPHGLVLDRDTDGHVDNVAACAPNGRLLVQGCDDSSEDDFARLAINRKVAESAVSASGTPFEVVEIPVLPFVTTATGRVVVPYLNFYVGNNFVLVPTCGHSADSEMLDLIGEAYPGRDVVDLPVGEILAVGGGGVHCITQQVPLVSA